MKPDPTIVSGETGPVEAVMAATNGRGAEVAITGAMSSPDQNKQARQLTASGDVVVSDLITHTFSLDRLRGAIDIVARGKAIKVTIEP